MTVDSPIASSIALTAKRLSSRLRRHRLCTYLSVLLFIWNGMPSHAAESVTCISRKVTFDGAVRLQYATVRAPVGPRLYLHARYPEHCSSQKQVSCLARAYLVPGDAIAVGKKCGGWDYVQYIGAKRIFEGWVASGALNPTPPPLPPKPPVLRIGKDVLSPSPPQRYHFELTRGEGKPVCEAYLQRLNQTEFYSPPYCGRPESTLVPGFALLHRRYLTVSEYKMLFYQALAVLSYQPLYTYYKPLKGQNGSITLVPSASRNRNFNGFAPGAWTYDPPLDVENSGQAGNVVIWTADSRYFSPCGGPNTRDGSPIRGSDAGVVLSPSGRTIDRAATYAVFGLANLDRYSPTIFPEFSDELGVFRYRTLNYFDGFLTGSRESISTEALPKWDPTLQATLAVFLYAHKHRQEVCEYHVSGWGG